MYSSISLHVEYVIILRSLAPLPPNLPTTHPLAQEVGIWSLQNSEFGVWVGGRWGMGDGGWGMGDGGWGMMGGFSEEEDNIRL